MFRTQNEIYLLDSADLLWLGRMCVGERRRKLIYNESESSAMCWAMINRWMLHPGRRHWLTFGYMLRAFSQPINPRWMAGGSLARKNEGKPSCTPAKLRRRARIAALPWRSIPERIKVSLEKFQDGLLLPPPEVLALENPRISNWASYRGVDKKFPGGVWICGNYFFEDSSLDRDAVLPDFW